MNIDIKVDRFSIPIYQTSWFYSKALMTVIDMEKEIEAEDSQYFCVFDDTKSKAVACLSLMLICRARSFQIMLAILVTTNGQGWLRSDILEGNKPERIAYTKKIL